MNMRSMIIAMASVLLVGVSPCAGQGVAEPCQRGWAPGFGLSGTNGAVNAMIEYDDGSGPALYVGGEFTDAEGITVNFIARWDGERWSALGDSEVGVNHFVHAMMVFDDGRGPALYVGGRFTKAGGVPASSIARWDGRAWSAVGAGFDGPVYSFAIWGGENGLSPALYAGGGFGHSGSAVARSLAKWNPSTSTWSEVGGGILGIVAALAVYDDGIGIAPALYVGGAIGTSNILKRSHVGWSSLNDTGVPALAGVNAPVTSLAVFDDDGNGPNPSQLYVGGANHYLAAIPGASSPGVSRWNGTSWSLLAAPLEGLPWPFAARVLLAINDVKDPMLVGAAAYGWSGAVARWTGSTWTLVGSSGFVQEFSQDTQLNALALARTGTEASPAVFAGGYFSLAGPSGAANVAQLKHSDWSPLGHQHGQGCRIWSLATFDDGSGHGTEIYAGRNIEVFGTRGVVKWDGSHWSVPGGGLSGNVYELADLTVGNERERALFAGGVIGLPSVSSGSIGIAKYAGDSWQKVEEGLNGRVLAITTFDDGLGDGPALYSGGGFHKTGNDVVVNSIARWNGRSWEPLGLGFPGGGVDSLAGFDDGTGPALYAGGIFESAGGVAVKNLARWNPRTASWSDVGGGMDSPGVWDPPFTTPHVYALAVFDDGDGAALYAAGRFTHAGGTLVNHIARWRNSNEGWTGVGGGMTSSSCTPCLYIHDLEVLAEGKGKSLIAGGLFAHAGGVSARAVARWDGRQWSALGLGLDNLVLAMTSLTEDDSSSLGASLFVGGDFEHAGDIASHNFARWGCAAPQCHADISPPGGNGAVNIDDLLEVLGAWGPCSGCAADITGDGVVNIDDLLDVIATWGPCP